MKTNMIDDLIETVCYFCDDNDDSNCTYCCVKDEVVKVLSQYDIDESMDKNTLVDMVSDVILEIQDIKEFMDKFPIK